MIVFRLQDRDGRGPFRPGFSDRWRDSDGIDFPPLYVELGWAPQSIASRIPPGYFAGSACRSLDLLHEWFSRSERRRLARFGFAEISFEPEIIIAETPTQVLVGSRSPFRTLGRVAT